MNSLRRLSLGTTDASIGFTRERTESSLCAVSKAGLPSGTERRIGSAKGFSTGSSYGSDELNMASAISWNGNMWRLSPRLTLGHFPMVSSAE